MKDAIKLSIDSEILKKGKTQIPNMSQFLEDCLKQYLGIGGNLVNTTQMQELINQISQAQLQLHLLNERNNIEENIEKTHKHEINMAWRKLYTEYRDTKTIPEDKLEHASKVLQIPIDQLTDIVEVCYVFSNDDDVDVTEWESVYTQYGE